MAHELDFNEAGVANMISVRETPWHKEGILLPEHPSYEDAMRLAGLDYLVECRPAWFEAHTPEGDTFQKRAVGSVVVRADREQALALVGPMYVPIQNRAAMSVLEPLVDSGRCAIETAGVLRDGGDAWMLVRWDMTQMGLLTQRVLDGGVHAYGLVGANHTGRRGVLLKDTPVRVVCANTLGAAENPGGITIRHTQKGNERLVEAAEALWGGVVQRYEKIAEAYQTLEGITLTPGQFETCVQRVITPITRLRPESPVAKAVAQRVEAQWSSLYHLWHEGKGQTGNRSAWEAYNACTEALDHDPQGVFKTRGPRLKQLLDGHLADAKNRVLQALLALAA